MIPVTRQDILAHRKLVPWIQMHQVEQDLLLCLAMIALFSDQFLSGHVAMRGGTVLHKVHLAPASRYSEDIDLVVVTERPEEHIRAAIKRVLMPVLGKHRKDVWEWVKLAVRNAASPSRILRLEYEVPSIVEAGRTLKLKVEANVTERLPHLPIVKLPFSVPFQNQTHSTELVSYDLNEMMGTKMRALFQRSAGRDLFDLYWALEGEGADPKAIIDAFLHYMRAEKKKVNRAAFLAAFDKHLKTPGFRTDMAPLLRADLTYDIDKAGNLVRERLLMKLPA